MLGRRRSGLRSGWLTLPFSLPLSLSLLVVVFLPSSLFGSNLADSARQLAHQIAAASGPGTFALDVSNRSSLDDKSVREVRSALEAQLQADGVHNATAEQATGTVNVVLSESLREYVWTAAIVIGSDEKKVALVSLPRATAGTPLAAASPIAIKTTLLFSREKTILDAAVVDMPGGARLIVLGDEAVEVYRAGNSVGRWELETSLSIARPRPFPRDLRGRLFLRRDHLFDVYLPGTLCRSGAAGALSMSLSITCSASDDPWPLTAEEGGVRAFYASSRNFFTGVLSPGIGKITTIPSFYSATTLPRSGYTLWAVAAVDGSLHMVDGFTDQVVRGTKWGSDLASVRSNCGVGTQVLATGSDDDERDGLRAYEIADRDPAAVSAAVEFDGQITALWPDSSGNFAMAIVRRRDTGWYEAHRISITCGN
jgi:hypothetical protein